MYRVVVERNSWNTVAIQTRRSRQLPTRLTIMGMTE